MLAKRFPWDDGAPDAKGFTPELVSVRLGHLELIPYVTPVREYGFEIGQHVAEDETVFGEFTTRVVFLVVYRVFVILEKSIKTTIYLK